MKKYLVFLPVVILMILASDCKLFCGWEEISISENYLGLNYIDFSPSGTAILVGDGGIVKITPDSGVTFEFHYMKNRISLLAAHFIDDKIILCGGNGGYLFRSTDAGKTWNSVNSGSNDIIVGIKFFNSASGILITQNGTVFKSSDAGTSWTQIKISQNYKFTDIDIADLTTAYIVGENGCILKTIDQGDTWNTILTGLSANNRKIQVVYKDYVFIGSDSLLILRSTDGGKNWSQFRMQTMESNGWTRPRIIGFSFFDENEAIVRVEDMYAGSPMWYEFNTNDSGKTWTANNLYGGMFSNDDYGYSMNYIKMFDKKYGIGVESTGGIYNLSVDDNLKYIYKNFFGNLNYKKTPTLLQALDDKNIAIITDNGSPATYLWLSTNGGETFTEKNLPFKGFDGGEGNIVNFAYSNPGGFIMCYNNWITTHSGNTTTYTPHGFLEKSEDNCSTFKEYRNPSGYGFQGVTMLDKDYGILNCWGKSFKYTIDGGTTWDTVAIPDTSMYISSIYTSGKSNIFLITNQNQSGNYIYFTAISDDWGKTWTMTENDVIKEISTMKFMNSQIGFALGHHNVSDYQYTDFFQKTTDGGKTWLKLYETTIPQYYTSFSLMDFDFIDENNILIAGGGGFIIMTTDGGINWEEQKADFISSNDNIRHICFPNEHLAVGITENGIIIRRTDFLPLSVNSQPENENSDFHIFPNPASEKINVFGAISPHPIKIYNLTGELVLESECKSEIDVSNLSTGIYLIKSGNKVIRLIKM